LSKDFGSGKSEISVLKFEDISTRAHVLGKKLVPGINTGQKEAASHIADVASPAKSVKTQS